MREPAPIEGGRSAVTMTAATLRVRSVVGRGGLLVLVVSFLTLMPMFSSIDCRDCSVNGALRKRVAGAVQADDEAVADDLVFAHALDVRDVLDADGGLGAGGGEKQDERKQDPGHDPSTTLTVPSGWTTPLMITPVSVFRIGMSAPGAPDCIAAP